MKNLVFVSFGVVGKDEKQEIVELSWVIANSVSLEVYKEERVFCKGSPEGMEEAVNQGFLTASEAVEVIKGEGDLGKGLGAALEKFSQSLLELNGSTPADYRIVTFGVNNFRVRLFKEARKDTFKIPENLKRCELFDLNQEVNKWLGSRVQGKNFQFSIAGLAKALSISFDSSTTALDNCRIMIKIMASILATNDSIDLFVKLADLSIDYEQFVEEKSKVIMLAGLPPKVTETEVLKWFSEFALKPIKLLTLKNPQTGLSFGVCQAFFSSHDKADSAFSLNLLPIDDRLIEVSPSHESLSTNFPLSPLPLNVSNDPEKDKVSDNNGFANKVVPHPSRLALAPEINNIVQDPNGYQPSYGYPTSHPLPPRDPRDFNGLQRDEASKVAPGDWTCANPECGTYNYSYRANCFNCQSMKPIIEKYTLPPRNSFKAPVQIMPTQVYRQSPYPSPAFPHASVSRGQDWLCPVSSCGFNNFASRMNCFRCGSGKQGPSPHGYGAPSAYRGDYGSAPPSEEWLCQNCKLFNFPTRSNCRKCNSSRVPDNNHQLQHGHQAAQPNQLDQQPPQSYQDGPSNNNNLAPGDWLCASCKTHNFSSRGSCRNCNNPKSLGSELPSQALPLAPTYGQPTATYPAHSFAPKETFRPGDWMCPSCNSHNFAARVNCRDCNASRIDSSGQTAQLQQDPHPSYQQQHQHHQHQQSYNPPPQTGYLQGEWVCLNCNAPNMALATNCRGCNSYRNSNVNIGYAAPPSAPPSARPPPSSSDPPPQFFANASMQTFKPGDWICPYNNCKFLNFAKRQTCGRCSGPRMS